MTTATEYHLRPASTMATTTGDQLQLQTLQIIDVINVLAYFYRFFVFQVFKIFFLFFILKKNIH